MELENKLDIFIDLFRRSKDSSHSDYDIFAMGIKSRDEVVNFLMSHFHLGDTSAQRSVMTRRANRVWSKIRLANDRVVKAGGEGVYSVQRSFFQVPVAFIYASSYEEANGFVSLFFKPLFPTYLLSAVFTKFGVHPDILTYNAGTLEGLASSIDNIDKRIHALQKDAAQKKVLVELITTIQDHAINNC